MVYFKKGLLCSLIFFSLACEEEKKRPDDVLGHPKMASIISDMMIAQNKVYHEGISGDSLQILFHSYHKDTILQQQNVTKEQFEKSYDYYVKEVERFDALWEVVVDSLSLRKERQKM